MFKTMTGCLDPKKKPSYDEIQKIPSYVFCRWLSGNMFTIQAANQINLMSEIPIENQYYMIKHAFGGKIKYIPYPKKESENNVKNVEYISNYFNISKEKAFEYLDFISEDELKSIINMYIEKEK